MNPTTIDDKVIYDALRWVDDPEIGCNIVDLGLVYSVHAADRTILVKMTLTTPGCPMHESIAWGVEKALLELPGIEEVKVEFVWDPPWNPAMMSDAGRAHVGIFD